MSEKGIMYVGKGENICRKMWETSGGEWNNSLNKEKGKEFKRIMLERRGGRQIKSWIDFSNSVDV